MPNSAPDRRNEPRHPLRVDAHLDLASNALGYDRDLLLPLDELRTREAAWWGHDEATRRTPGTATVSLPAMRRAGVRLCMASIFARVKPREPHGGLPRRDDVDFHHPIAGEAAAMAQAAWYRGMAKAGRLRIVEHAADLPDLDAPADDDQPIAVVLMLEGCDPIVNPDDTPAWRERGVRVACLAHYGEGRYAMGTGGDGPLTDAGRRLVPRLGDAGIALDLSHTADTAFDQALSLHHGAVCASHCNTRMICHRDRQLTDAQIRALADRGGVVGVVPYNPMIVNCPIGHRPPQQDVSLDRLADHVDHICQLAGSAAHVGVGSDLDGGFGREAIPHGLDSIADLPRLGDVLLRRGYSEPDVAAVMGGNWHRWLAEALS